MHEQHIRHLLLTSIHADPLVPPCILKIVFKDQAFLLLVKLIVFLIFVYPALFLSVSERAITLVSDNVGVVPPGGLADLQFSEVALDRSMWFKGKGEGANR